MHLQVGLHPSIAESRDLVTVCGFGGTGDVLLSEKEQHGKPWFWLSDRTRPSFPPGIMGDGKRGCRPYMKQARFCRILQEKLGPWIVVCLIRCLQFSIDQDFGLKRRHWLILQQWISTFHPLTPRLTSQPRRAQTNRPGGGVLSDCFFCLLRSLQSVLPDKNKLQALKHSFPNCPHFAVLSPLSRSNTQHEDTSSEESWYSADLIGQVHF